MDSWASAFALLALALVPPIFAIWSLRERNSANQNRLRRRWLSFFALGLWASLVVFWGLQVTWRIHWATVAVYIADAFLLLSVLLLMISALSKMARWRLLCAGVVLVALWATTEQRCARFGQGSEMSVLLDITGGYIGLDRPSDSYTVLNRMAQYRRRGFYRPAVALGDSWIASNPTIPADGVLISMAAACLEKARHDQGNVELYVGKALEYRDNALKATKGTPLSYGELEHLAVISEVAGDLSPKQRCVQYGNAIKIYDYFATRLMRNETKSHAGSFRRKMTSRSPMLMP